MISLKKIVIINIILLVLLLIYYFRFEITGFFSNAASIYFSIKSADVILSITINGSEFCPGDTMKMTNRLYNPGSNTYGDLWSYVVDSHGYKIFQDEWKGVQLGNEEEKFFDSLINFTNDNEIGGYNINSHFINENISLLETRSFLFRKGIGILTVSPPYIEKTIDRGGIKNETLNIWLVFACNGTTVSISKSNDVAASWITFSREKVFVPPNLVNVTTVNIRVPLETQSGDYSTEIYVSAENQKITIPTIIHVSQVSFDLDLYVDNETEVCTGSPVSAQLNITKRNMGGEARVNMTYQILDKNFLIVSNSTEELGVIDKIQKNVSLVVPSSSEDGYYTFIASLQFENITEQESSIFSVKVCKKPETPSSGGGGGGGGAPLTERKTNITQKVKLSISKNIIASLTGEKQSFLATVSNIGDIDLTNVRLVIEGIPTTWYKVIPEESNIAKDSNQEYLVVLQIPKNAATGTYTIKVKAVVGKIESEKKEVTLIIGKTKEELADKLLEEMEKWRSIAKNALAVEKCIDISKIKNIFEEAEKSREKGLDEYKSKNSQRAIDWFQNAINYYRDFIDGVDIKAEVKRDSIKNTKIIFLPVLGLQKEIEKFNQNYSSRDYEKLCSSLSSISRLKKLSTIFYLAIVVIFIICVYFAIIFIKRKKAESREQKMQKIKERLAGFRIETLENEEEKAEL